MGMVVEGKIVGVLNFSLASVRKPAGRTEKTPLPCEQRGSKYSVIQLEKRPQLWRVIAFHFRADMTFANRCCASPSKLWMSSSDVCGSLLYSMRRCSRTRLPSNSLSTSRTTCKAGWR